MTAMTREASSAVRAVRTVALILSLMALVQAALGGTVLSGGEGIKRVHGYVGYATVVVAVIAAVIAWRAARQTGNRGTFMHALSLPILALIQVALGEMELKWVHVGVGLLFLVAAFGLFAMADRPARPQ